MKKLSLAPIILFVYNRPLHTKQTIKALLENPLAKDSEIFIYSDAPKNHEAQEKVKEVREYIRSIQGFKNITIFEREKNFGLADNVIDGVTFIVNKYGKVIVLEDDIIVSPVFLNYMNDALERYKNEDRVWNINAYCLPAKYSKLGIDCFFTREVNCWGWATWKNRWKLYKRDTRWALSSFSKKEIRYLNFNSSHNYWNQVKLNDTSKIKTWFVFFYLLAVKNNALALSPSRSYIKQIGFDGSGTHCDKNIDFLYTGELNTKFPINYPKIVEENKEAFKITKHQYFKIKICLLFLKIKKVFYNDKS